MQTNLIAIKNLMTEKINNSRLFPSMYHATYFLIVRLQNIPIKTTVLLT